MGNIDHTNFTDILYQASIFTVDDYLSINDVLTKFYTKVSDTFDAEPAILPISPNIPTGFPLITLSNKEGSLVLELAMKQVNFFWKKRTGLKLDIFQTYCKNMFSDFTKTMNFKIGRIALVIHRMAEHDSPGIFLARHFCDKWAEAPLNRPESFELHSHKKYLLAKKYNVNSWIRNRTREIMYKDSQKKIISVEQDINTFAEEIGTSVFDLAGIESFFEVVSSEANSILKQYFPKKG